MRKVNIADSMPKEILASVCPNCNPREFNDLISLHIYSGVVKAGEPLLVNCRNCGRVEVEEEKQ